ncbi:zinc finger protein 1 homolog isoform X2 [Pectinophora gossypiella]|uniref:zinc finger protein 1 homolog isoform X2 n=1 Tax=Pectinophora gossypiella TaxID=13191 RepID=UPI00214E7D87|nr:zinc finger protein 1 homolog isoform X2 [Pectinophora gossypiella]
MSSFLCFICHSTVNNDTNEETREKYKEIIGIYLCLDSHLCYICCHIVNKLWLFKSVCLKRSLEYPMLFSEKGTLNLQKTELVVQTICLEETCNQYGNRNINSKTHHIQCEDTNSLHHEEYPDNPLHHQSYVDNRYVKLVDDGKEFDEFFQQDDMADSLDEIQHMDDQIEATFSQYSPEDNFKETRNDNDDQYFEPDNPITDNFNTDLENDILSPTNDAISREITEIQEETRKKDKKKSKKGKKKEFEKITLTLEQQKTELERRRKEKKYMEAEFKCYNCALGFLFKDTYQTHMMRHEESNGEYRCVTCTLRFATPAVLRAHTAGHRERYECARCAAQVTPRARHTHARACYPGRTDSVACHLCGGMFADGSALQQHLKRFHQMKTSTRSYSCSVCGKTYSNQAAVRTHMIKHINRKFTCSECGSKFSSPYTLAQHSKKHSTTNKSLALQRPTAQPIHHDTMPDLFTHVPRTEGFKSAYQETYRSSAVRPPRAAQSGCLSPLWKTISG